MPRADKSKLKFDNIKNMEEVPFVIFADMEAATTPIDNAININGDGDSDGEDGVDVEMDENDDDAAAGVFDDEAMEDNGGDDEEDREPIRQTRRRVKHVYQQHKAISYGLKLVSRVPGVLDNLPYETYTGEDAADKLVERLLELEEQCVAFLFDEQRLVMTNVDWNVFNNATECYICRKAFTAVGGDNGSVRRGLWKVRDHDHISGNFRGAAHSGCNLLLRRQRKVPVFMHNLRGYDSHLIVPAFGNHPDKKLSVIGQTMEKYMVINFSNHLVFKDSLMFLPNASLESLVKNLLSAGRDQFRQMIAGFDQNTDAQVDMMLRKGVYPYDWMESIDRLDAQELPSKADFFSRLNQTQCDDADYEHAKRVWEEFGCRTFKDYHNLYLKCDVLQLADVFEGFRDMCLREYQLDPAHYVSAPHLSW